MLIFSKQFRLQIGTNVYDYGWETLSIDDFPEKTFYANGNNSYEISKMNELWTTINITTIENSDLFKFLNDRANAKTSGYIDLILNKKVEVGEGKIVKRVFQLSTVQRPSFGTQVDGLNGSDDIVKVNFRLHVMWKDYITE